MLVDESGLSEFLTMDTPCKYDGRKSVVLELWKFEKRPLVRNLKVSSRKVRGFGMKRWRFPRENIQISAFLRARPFSKVDAITIYINFIFMFMVVSGRSPNAF